MPTNDCAVAAPLAEMDAVVMAFAETVGAATERPAVRLCSEIEPLTAMEPAGN